MKPKCCSVGGLFSSLKLHSYKSCVRLPIHACACVYVSGVERGRNGGNGRHEVRKNNPIYELGRAIIPGLC